MARGIIPAGLDWLLNPLFGTGGDEEAAKAREYYEKYYADGKDFQAPNLEEFDPEAYRYVGDVNPELLGDYEDLIANYGQASNLAGTAYDDISTDPRLREQQLAALDELAGISESGGLRLSDKAQLNEIFNGVAQQDRGRREAIQQNMQARGMGGSGLELLAQLQSSQAATDDANQRGMDIAALAQDRALESILEGGDLAGELRRQDYGEQADAARARDILAQFNARNAQEASFANAGMANEFARYNQGRDMGIDQYNNKLANEAAYNNRQARQNIWNANTELSNSAQAYNKGDRVRNQFDMQMDAADQRRRGTEVMGSYWDREAERKARERAGLIGGVMEMGSKIFDGATHWWDKMPKNASPVPGSGSNGGGAPTRGTGTTGPTGRHPDINIDHDPRRRF